MPGSPPTRSTEPRTKPPPVTRSSSAMPEGRRGASTLLPVSVSSANVRPLRLERIETGIEVEPVVSSSASVFHSPQDSHLPCQRLYAAPQFWQTKERGGLAIRMSRRGIASRLIAWISQCSYFVLNGFYGTGPFPSRLMVSGPFTILAVAPFENPSAFTLPSEGAYHLLAWIDRAGLFGGSNGELVSLQLEEPDLGRAGQNLVPR